MEVSKDFALRLRLRKKINDKIDLAIATGKKHNQPDLVIELMDKSFRQFCLSLHEERRRQGPGADADETKDIVCNLLANMMVEMLLNVAERDDPDEMVIQANDMLARFTDHFNVGIQMNYGLTTTAEHGIVGGQSGDEP